MKTITHNGIEFKIEKYVLQISAYGEPETRFQAWFGNDGVALSDMEKTESVAIMAAIKTINENMDRFQA